MRSFTGSNGTTFHFNSDCSGEVIIDIPSTNQVVKVDGSDLNEFARLLVGNYVISLVEEYFG